jgi:hypothetical protein
MPGLAASAPPPAPRRPRHGSLARGVNGHRQGGGWVLVAKLKAARDRKRKVIGKAEGRKSYIEREGGLSLIARVKALRDHMAEGEELDPTFSR